MSDNSAAVRAIHAAWDEEGSIGRLGMRPAANKDIQKALIPGGGDWQCIVHEGAISRTIVWNRTEVALVNPRGDLHDHTEGRIAMGLRAMPVVDKALRVILILAQKVENLDFIRDIARAAVDYIEQPAPRVPDPTEDEDDFEEET